MAGVGALFAGLGIIVKTPALWPFALVPVAIGAAITTALSVVAVSVIPGLMAGWLGPAHGTLAVIAAILGVAVAVVLALALGLALAQPLSGFALEKIVHHVEASEGAPAWPQASFFVNLKRSLASVAVSAAFGIPVLTLLFAVNFVFPPAVVVTFPLKVVVTALLVAWDLCDYPLSREMRSTETKCVEAEAKYLICLSKLRAIGAVDFPGRGGILGLRTARGRLEVRDVAKLLRAEY